MALTDWLFFPKPAKVDGDPPGQGLRMVGVILALLGAFGLIVVAVLTAKGILASADVPCNPLQADKNKTLPSVSVLGALTVNGTACLVVQPAALFKPQIAVRTAAVVTKEAELKAAEASSGTDRDSRISVARNALDQVRAQATAPIPGTDFAIFIDGRKTAFRLQQGYVPGEDKPIAHRVVLNVPIDAKSDEAKVWRALLSGAGLSGSRAVIIGIAAADQAIPLLITEPGSAILEVYSPLSVCFGASALLIMAFGVVMAGWYTGLLRDGPYQPVKGADETVKMVLPPFSLARIQMAWWFFIVLAGFMFIWLVTGQFNGVMNSAALTLIGISLSSGLAARVIDAAPNRTIGQSRTMLADILFDGTTVSMHRLQMTVWTLVLGGAFLWSVIYTYSFPEFDTSLLVLAGIVNGTYIGFKLPENVPKVP